MVDPLAEIVSFLQLSAPFSKQVEGAGRWRVRRQAEGEPFYCAVLEGQCRMTVDGYTPMNLQAGDFVLVPAMHDLVNTSMEEPEHDLEMQPVQIAENHFRVGAKEGPVTMRARIGHCRFGARDAALLVPLLPQVLLVRGEPRLATLVQLLGDETRADRPAREVMLERLLEVLLIEALRSGVDTGGAPGLARGLADERLASALRAVHARPGYPWTITEMAQQASLSRSAFFSRFSSTVGVAPMEYLLVWRMALAKRLLREQKMAVAQVAEQVGYASASTFSVAFARHVGLPPGRFGQGVVEAAG